MQLGSHFTGKLFVIKRYVVLGIRKARHQGTRAFTLVGGLAIGCRIREFFIIENPIGVQSFDLLCNPLKFRFLMGVFRSNPLEERILKSLPVFL